MFPQIILPDLAVLRVAAYEEGGVFSVAKPKLFNFGSGFTFFFILAPAPAPTFYCYLKSGPFLVRQHKYCTTKATSYKIFLSFAGNLFLLILASSKLTTV